MIKVFKTKEEWLNARKIGGTDLCKIVDRVGKWGNFIELYDKLTNEKKADQGKETDAMRNGKEAENHIRQLFLLSHPELKDIGPKAEWWLIQNNEMPEITLSPDTLVNNNGFIEIKYKTIFNEKKIAEYMQNLKEIEPQYYWQCIHYFVADDALQYGYLVVAFNVQEKDEKGEWKNSKIIIENLHFTRQAVNDDITLAKHELNDFIINNLRVKHRPETMLENQKKQGEIEWTKLSNIAILK